MKSLFKLTDYKIFGKANSDALKLTGDGKLSECVRLRIKDEWVVINGYELLEAVKRAQNTDADGEF